MGGRGAGGRGEGGGGGRRGRRGEEGGGGGRWGEEGGGGGGGVALRRTYVARTMCWFYVSYSSSGSASLLYHVVPSTCLVKQTSLLTIRQKTLFSICIMNTLVSTVPTFPDVPDFLTLVEVPESSLKMNIECEQNARQLSNRLLVMILNLHVVSRGLGNYLKNNTIFV